jgi:hypothetical protein
VNNAKFLERKEKILSENYCEIEFLQGMEAESVFKIEKNWREFLKFSNNFFTLQGFFKS